jgi:hypothetical protein
LQTKKIIIYLVLGRKRNNFFSLLHALIKPVIRRSSYIPKKMTLWLLSLDLGKQRCLQRCSYTIFPWRHNNKSFTVYSINICWSIVYENWNLWCNINLFFVSIFKYLLYFLSLRSLCKLTKIPIGDTEAKEGDLVNLLYSAQGEPPITFSWEKDQKPLESFTTAVHSLLWHWYTKQVLGNIFVISEIDFKALVAQFRYKKIQVIVYSIYSSLHESFTNFIKQNLIRTQSYLFHISYLNWMIAWSKEVHFSDNDIQS